MKCQDLFSKIIIKKIYLKVLYLKVSSAAVVIGAYNGSVFVCVEVLRPSQPNGVMSSAVNLPNHTFTEQLSPLKA